MRRHLALILLAFLALPAATASAAKKAPCDKGDRSGPQCLWWNAKVTLVADGDTVKVNIPGEGPAEVRFIGLNAMEMHRYSHTPSKRRGDCMAVAATNNIDRIISANHNRVQLAAQRKSSRSGRRIRRSVWVGGIDLAKRQLQDGYAVFLPNGEEWAHNLDYQVLAAQARQRGRNLWNPNACGGGQQDAKLSVVAKWDADGADERNLNDEYVEVRNLGTKAVDLSGWWVRDSWLNWWKGKQHGTPGYRFAPGTTLGPLSFLRVHIGRGNETADNKFWGQRSSAFENVTYDRTHMGDGAYLFDSKGGLRASFLYPCKVACSDPLAGKVRLAPHPSNPEAIGIVNTAGGQVNLVDHVLKLRNRGKSGEYVFGDVFGLSAGSIITRGATWRPPTANRFSDNGGVVELRTLDDQLTACAAWGFGRC
jgi:endonuclease YncB( thermonuclease family)